MIPPSSCSPGSHSPPLTKGTLMVHGRPSVQQEPQSSPSWVSPSTSWCWLFFPRAPKHRVLPPQAKAGGPTAVSNPTSARVGPEMERAEASRLILAHMSSGHNANPPIRKEYSSEQGIPMAAVPGASFTPGEDKSLIPAPKGWAQLEQLFPTSPTEFGENRSSTGSAEIVSALFVAGALQGQQHRDTTGPQSSPTAGRGSGSSPGWPGHCGRHHPHLQVVQDGTVTALRLQCSHHPPPPGLAAAPRGWDLAGAEPQRAVPSPGLQEMGRGNGEELAGSNLSPVLEGQEGPRGISSGSHRVG